MRFDDGGERVSKEETMTYPEKAKQIISLAEGMTHSEWSRINHLINNCFESQEAKVTFVQPKQLDLLMKQNVIL